MDSQVFIEGFLTRLAPFYNEVTLDAIRHFHFEQYPPNAALAAVGALIASVLYFLFGIFLRRMPEKVSTEEQQLRIEVMRAQAHFWMPYLLVLAPTPVGGVVVMAAAFFRMKPWKVALIVLVTEIVWRAMPYINKATS